MAVTRIVALAGLAAAVALSCVCGAPSSRILDGSDASAGQYPWVTSVRLDSAHVAVGNIIDAQHILTAAHSLSQLGATPVGAERVTVRVGSINQFAGGQIVNVASVHIHPSYGNFLHDIALLKLAQPLVLSGKINKIELAKATDEALEEGTAVTVAGWGLQQSGASPYKLQHTTLSVLGGPSCELKAGYGYDSALCLQHDEQKGICRGDDGAGVVANNKLVGTVSFAFGSCGTKYPDVACKVSYYDEWIASVVA